MVKWPRILLLVVAAALAAWAWIALHPGDEKLIRKQLKGVARTASFGPNQGNLAKVAASESLEISFPPTLKLKSTFPATRNTGKWAGAKFRRPRWPRARR